MEKRQEAKKIWINSDGNLSLATVAKEIDCNPATVRSWKKKDDWAKALSQKKKREKEKAEKKKRIISKKEKSEERIQAERMFLDSNGNIKYKEIANALGVACANINYWQKTDNWQGKLHQKNAAIRNGYQKGTDKAGAPPGNQNAVKHGLRSRLLFRNLEEEELDLIDEVYKTKHEMLKEEIELLTVREARMLSYLKKIKEKVDAGVNIVDGLTIFQHVTKTGMIRENQRIHASVNPLQYLEKFEKELTKIQRQKQMALDAMHKWEVDLEKLKIIEDKMRGNLEKSYSFEEEFEALLNEEE